ncbi:tetratricopeptide repeat protein [Bernardetia sp. ABR2-2B]|uniref:tetratricopeptide repeat protein n=1 Tax=Bernardetia sp. ABR2-2B TaxID=3127472 RepID=UPI0030D20ADD
MKIYEIVVIALFIITIILQFFNIGEDTALIILLSADTLLALSYFIGGYWLFKKKQNDEEGNKNKAISILGGFAFGIALICFWTRIIVTPNEIISYLPFANIVFFVILLILIIIKRNDSIFTKNNKPILIRSFVILIITCFFFYVPIEFEPYNDLIRSMNVSSKRLQHNLNMAKYHEKAKIELDNENYEKAVEYAEIAELEGRRGFLLPDNPIFLENGEVDTTFFKKLPLRNMNLVYARLYTAYTNLANENLENDDDQQALKNYEIAHQILYIYNLNDGQWEQQNVISFANMGKALSYLNRFEEADDEFNKAFLLIDSSNVDSKKISFAYSVTAKSLAMRELYEESNNYHKASIDIQLQSSIHTDSKEYLAENYMEMGKNYVFLLKTDKAIQAYQQVFHYSNKNSDTYRQTCIYYGIVNFQLYNYEKAESIFLECIKLYGNIQDGLSNVGVSKNLLARNYIQLNKYKEAEKFLQEGIEITRTEEGKTSSNYVFALSVYANLNSILSNYKEAEKQYQEAFELSKNRSGKNSSETIQLFIQLANTKINLSKLKEIEELANQANEMLAEMRVESSINLDNLVNELAYLNYSAGNYFTSREIYELVIKADEKHNDTQALTTGIALNGLGLLEMNDKKYIEADSLFHQSLEIHKAIFKTSNPSLATLYLNMAKLYILKNEYQKAENNLAISLKMNQDLFNEKHTNFADIEVAYGDLALQQNKEEEANQHYQKALKIYLAKFDEDHYKIQSVKE